MREITFLNKDEDIGPVIERVREHMGIDFSHYRETTLRRRINRRMAMRNCDGLAAYICILDSDTNEYSCLCADLTIKYSEFFRDPEVFGVIKEGVLPELMSDRGAREDGLNILSAGCATGEEAYSMAILIRQMDGERAAKITGMDIDPAALEFARLGIYRKDLLPGPIPDWARPHFTDDGKNISVDRDIKQMVEFRVQDLLSISVVEDTLEVVPNKFDLILCRNVLIYLKRPAQSQVLTACCEMLRPGGFLIIGNREIVPKDFADVLEPYNVGARVYRKRG